MKELSLGFDRGNEKLKVATLVGTKFVEFSTSSYVALGDLDKYNAIKEGSAVAPLTNIGARASDYLVIGYDGSVYFLGDMAHQGKNETTSFGDLDRYSSLHTKLSVMCAVAKLAEAVWPTGMTEEVMVNLVMGVPLQAHHAKAASISEALVGSYRFQFNGKPMHIHVDSCRVFIEGTGAAVNQGLPKDSHIKTVVVDSGSLTTAYLLFNGMVPNSEMSGSFKIGVNSALDKMNMAFEREYGRLLDKEELQLVLRSSIGIGEYPELYSPEGVQVSGIFLNEWMKKAIEETGNDRNSRISAVWADEKGRITTGFRKVFHTGGGGYYYHGSLKKILKSAELIGEPEKANARGYAVLANQIGLRRAQKGA